MPSRLQVTVRLNLTSKFVIGLKIGKVLSIGINSVVLGLKLKTSLSARPRLTLQPAKFVQFLPGVRARNCLAGCPSILLDKKQESGLQLGETAKVALSAPRSILVSFAARVRGVILNILETLSTRSGGKLRIKRGNSGSRLQAKNLPVNGLGPIVGLQTIRGSTVELR